VRDSERDLIMRYNRQANPKRSFIMQNRQNHWTNKHSDICSSCLGGIFKGDRLVKFFNANADLANASQI